MSNLLLSLEGAVSQGVLWGILVLGVYITYKILNIADLTVDGSFALGGCVCAVMIVQFNMNPILALLLATLAGGLAGFVTGVLHTVFKIPAILAGILTQISLWSINLMIMSGKSNVPLLNSTSIFTYFTNKFNLNQSDISLIIGVIIAILIIILQYWIFGTEIGCSIRATGNNREMVSALGINSNKMVLLGLIFSNALVGLSGGLVAQSQKYADINMGTGAIVIGLAAIVIGEVLMKKFVSFGTKLTSVVIGSIIYFMIRAIVLRLGMDANYMKLISAIIVALALSIPVLMEKINDKKSYNKGGEADVRN